MYIKWQLTHVSCLFGKRQNECKKKKGFDFIIDTLGLQYSHSNIVHEQDKNPFLA